MRHIRDLPVQTSWHGPFACCFGRDDAELDRAVPRLPVDVTSNPCHWHSFPPSPRTLWELTQIRPKQVASRNCLEFAVMQSLDIDRTALMPGSILLAGPS